MKKLFSPWRSNYIDSFKYKLGNEDCVFCGIEEQNITGEDSLVVKKGEFSYIMLNRYPYNSGHIMVIPYRHISQLIELSLDEMTEMMDLLKLATRCLDEIMKPQGYNMGANFGKAGGAGIDTHIHFHLVPRWEGDTNFMPVLGEVKMISQDLLETKNHFINQIKIFE